MLVRGRKLLHQMRLHWQLYVFLLLPVVYLILFKYIPMAGIQIAFRKFSIRKGIWHSPWVGFQYFERFFGSYMFGRVLKNTLVLSAYSIFAGFPMPILFALCLNVMRNRAFKKTVQMITYAPHFISTTVLVGMLMSLLNCRTGMYGALFSQLFGSFPPDLFGIGKAFKHLYVWSGIWQEMGWGAIIYIAALSSVDTQLHEAAEIDGAGRLKRVIHIDLPCILPTAAIMLIMRAGSVMSIGFEKVYLMQNNVNLAYSEIISTYVYKVGLQDSDFSYSTAIGLFNSVVNLTLLFVVNTITRRLSDTSLF